MKKKLTVLCDADDTIEDMLPYWIDELNQKHDLSVQKADIKAWDMRKAFPTLTVDQIYEPVRQKAFWNRITPVRNSALFLKEIMEDGHDLYIVTASHYSMLDVKIAKILDMFPFLSWKQIIVAYDKQLVHGDVIIDDGIHNLIGNPCPHKFLFHQPHNANIDETQFGIQRVRSWDEIYGKILVASYKK